MGAAIRSDPVNGVAKDSPRNDPMLTRTQRPANTHTAIEGGELTLLASPVGEGTSAAPVPTQLEGSEQVVQEPRSLDALPPRSHPQIGGCVDGTMKGPAGLRRLGDGSPMVRAARVGICASSRMEEWTLWSLWGQRYGLGSQREGDVRSPGEWEFPGLAAPRVTGFGRGPNRRGETTVPSGAV